MTVRRAAALVCVALLAGCGGKTAAPPATTAHSDGFPVRPSVRTPPFLLPDQAGRRVGPQLFRGHWTAVTFLYTHCPDVCPLIADQLAAAQRRDRSLRVIAVSVDPARDTPRAVRRFVAAHHEGRSFHYVVGPRRALRRVWRSYHVAALPGPSGTVSHSAFTVLVDPAGRQRLLFDSHIRASDLLAATKG
jgi:protein SCO1